MTTLIVGSRFTGAGLADAGLRDSGFVKGFAWGIECDPHPKRIKTSMAIADMYEANFGQHMIRRPVWDVNPRTIQPVDVIWDSPVCKQFSQANVTGGGESHEDVLSARSSCEFLQVIRPKVYFLENVRGYVRSDSFKMIRETLQALGYWVGFQVVNAADAGVPQTRDRLILRAVRRDCVDAVVSAGQFGLFDDGLLPPMTFRQSWIGWYAAIEDLIPTLPESQFAPWQLARMPENLKTVLVGVGGYNGKITYRQCQQPSFTVTAEFSDQVVRAFIVGGGNTNTTELRNRPPRYANDPMFTVTPNTQCGTTAYSEGRTVAMTAAAIARFQTVPAWYCLSGNTKTDVTAIGNGVPSKLAQSIATQTLGGFR